METTIPSTVEYGFRRIIITITLIACTLLEMIDTSIVNVATTQLMGNLGCTMSEISWVVAAYSIANVIVVPMSGWLSIRLGRRNYFGGSVILFTIASVLCGNSTNIWELVFFRFVQGLGGGALLATSQTILTEIYPPQDRGKASALYGMGVIMGPTLGPLMGGFIVDNYDWPMIFYVNIPIGIIAAFLTFTFIKDVVLVDENIKKLGVDWMGIFLLVAGVGALQFILEKGEEKDWFETTYISVATAIAVFGILFFVLWETRWAKNPVVDFTILSKGNVAIGTVLSFILGFGLFSSVFIYPIFVQRFLGFTAFQTGLSLLPGALTSGFMMPIVGTMLAKGFKPKYMIPFGLLIFAIFTFSMSQILTPQTGDESFTIPLLIRGIGLGLLFVPLTTMTLGGLHGRDIGSAAGLTGMIRQLGGSFGVALCSTFIGHMSMVHRADLVSHLSVYDAPTMERVNLLTLGLMSKAQSVAAATQQAYAAIDLTILKQATLLTYIDTFMYLGVFFIACIPLVLFAKNLQIDKGADTSGGH